ncbi:hypothetical protein [Thermogemmatispora carboxidivorans]|uniref:hypothetical protein n=1 Tax=Thermogemmatispora carboxidivorans TaxID=1382306 RepID=UPI00069B4941|nr:hypothetical protein [Thermogemmatispora carboxidivorans]
MQQRQERARSSLFRRIFFPYSGGETLTIKQSLRIIIAWALVIPVSMTLLTLVLSLLLGFSPQRIVLLVLITFLSGVMVFGLLSLVVIATNNRAARLRQERQGRFSQRRQTAAEGEDRGGRYGS